MLPASFYIYTLPQCHNAVTGQGRKCGFHENEEVPSPSPSKTHSADTFHVTSLRDLKALKRQERSNITPKCSSNHQIIKCSSVHPHPSNIPAWINSLLFQPLLVFSLPLLLSKRKPLSSNATTPERVTMSRPLTVDRCSWLRRSTTHAHIKCASGHRHGRDIGHLRSPGQQRTYRCRRHEFRGCCWRCSHVLRRTVLILTGLIPCRARSR